MMPREVSQNVINALRLIECFAKEEELGITDLSEAIGVGKTVTARLVSSLEQFEYLRQNPESKRYRLGMKLAYLGSLVRDRREIIQLVEPYMWLLCKEFQVSAHLAVQENDTALIIDKVSMGPIVYMDSRIGATLPWHASATGKCLLAFGEPQGLDRILHDYEFTRYTKTTQVASAEFLTELHEARAKGYTIDAEESIIGLTCIGVPLLDAGGHLVAAISLSGQAQFMIKEKRTIIRRLREVQKEISQYL